MESGVASSGPEHCAREDSLVRADLPCAFCAREVALGQYVGEGLRDLRSVLGDQPDRCVEVGDRAHSAVMPLIDPHAKRGRPCDHVIGTRRGQVDHDDVGVGHDDLGPTHAVHEVREIRGGLVIVGQSVKMVFEAVERARGENATLAHSPSKTLTGAMRARDEVGGTDETRADWCAESLGKRHHNGVGTGGEVGE